MELTKQMQIDRLLKQLEDPNLTRDEIEKIKSKVTFLEQREQ